MGRRTKGEDPTIINKEIKREDTNALDTIDIFEDHVNHGPEGDLDERVRTF
jgi:hypothetical protein